VKFVGLVLSVALVVLAAPIPALAGPNAGGVLILHASPPDSTATCDTGGLAACSLAVVSVPADSGQVILFHALAAFPDSSSPRLKGLIFGIRYDPVKFGLVGWGNCANDEWASPQWPGTGTGNSVVWDSPQTARLVPVYWFEGYAYSTSDSTLFELTANPDSVLGGVFLDDSVPSNQDPIADYGKLGFGMAGYLPCPHEAEDNGQGDGNGGQNNGGSEQPPGGGEAENHPPSAEGCVPNVVLIRFAPNEVSFSQDSPHNHAPFTASIEDAQFADSALGARLKGLGATSFETIAPNWRHMTEEEKVDIHGRHVDLVDFTDVYRVSLDGRASLDNVLTDLWERPGIAYLECDPLGESFAVPNPPNDPNYPCQWYLDFSAVDSCGTQGCSQNPTFDVNAPEAWALQDSAGTMIGISDQAIHRSVPGLSEYIDHTLSRSFVSGQPWWTDGPNHHGTFVASIAAAGTNDSLPLASIPNLPANFNDSLIVALRVDADPTDGANALAYVCSSEVNRRIRVVNHSWGHPSCRLEYQYNATLRDAIRNAFLSDINLVCASGNDLLCHGLQGCGADTCFAYPAAFTDYALAVAAVDCNGYTHPDYKIGSYIDLAAPGRKICYLDEGGVTCPDTTFTSYSAPLASGAIALLLGADSALTNEDCYNILKLTARPITGSSPITVGAGLLQVDEALRQVLPPRRFSHGTTSTYDIQEVEPHWLWIENGPRQLDNHWDQRWARIYRLTSLVFMPDSLVEHVWPLGRTSSGGRLIDANFDYHYDLKFYSNLASTERVGGTGARFTSYTYELFTGPGGDSLGWFPFDPDTQAYRLDYSYIAQGSPTGGVDGRSDGGFGDRIRIVRGPTGVAIEWFAATTTSMSVCIYDVGGREVCRLISDPQPPGYRVVQWRGRDGRDKRLPSGIYFIRIQPNTRPASGRVTTGRIVLIR
jgi:hypothetical protein